MDAYDDRRDLAWYVDKAVAVLMFLGGVSAIVFILGIFTFITREGDAAFRNWLYTAALRKLVEHDRRLHAQKRDIAREVVVDPQDGVDQDLVAGYATMTTPSLVAMGKEGAANLEAAFDELSEEHREIVTLARIVGLSHQEIAAQLGKSEESCRQLLRRALVKLSMALEKRGIAL